MVKSWKMVNLTSIGTQSITSKNTKNLKEVNWQIFNDLPVRYSSHCFSLAKTLQELSRKDLIPNFKKEGGGELLSGYSKKNHEQMQILINTELKWERELILNAIKEFEEARRAYDRTTQNRSNSAKIKLSTKGKQCLEKYRKKVSELHEVFLKYFKITLRS